MTTPSDVRVRLLRDHAAAVLATTAATALVLFLILRVAAPWLVNRHDTLALWLAALLLLACPFVALYAGWTLWALRRRYRDRLAAAR